MRKLAALVLLGLTGACAPKTVPVPVVSSAPKFPDFMEPVVPAALSDSPAALSQIQGWRSLQAGDLKSAERAFSTALKTTPAFYPAETALGYVELARKDAKAALPHFDRSLERGHQDLSALLGRGQTLLALNRESDALEAFEAALAADPSLAEVRRQVDVLRFRGQGQDLARARQLSASGRLDESALAYARAIAGSPDSPFLYRELGVVERRKGDIDQALEHFRRAVALDATDASSLVQIGEMLEGRDDLSGAQKAYAEALALEPNDSVTAKLESIRQRNELARLPPEYRAIEQAPQITRADLAALIGVRLAPVLEAGRRGEAVLVTDVRSDWAAEWIMAVARAGVIEPLANHAFQPRALVRRIDLAQAVSRLLARIGAADPSRAKSWDSARVRFSDLSPGHLAYPAASAAVAAGVMQTGPGNSFQPYLPVSGAEATAAINRIAALAGPLATGQSSPGR